MRIGTLLACTLVGLAGSIAPLPAQGIKDPPNNSSGILTQKSGTGVSPQQPSRPTSVTNVPTNQTPSGTSVQRVYRNGKLITIVR